MKIVYTEAEYVALLDRFKKGDEKKYRGVNTLYGIPVEVEDGNTVRVVRCKDCVGKATWYKDGCDVTVCGTSSFYVVEDNDFCSYGERREEV